LTEEIAKTIDIVKIVISGPRIRRRRGLSTLTMQRSGARSITPQDMIWKDCKTFLDHKKMPPPAAQVAQEPQRGEHYRANPPDDDEQMGEINVIFGGSMSITSKTHGKKLERDISLAQRIEPGRMMRWSNMDILFKPDDNPETELSDRNLPFVVKLPIGWHKVAKTLIDNVASLNLIMRKIFIKMGLNLKDLTPIHDVFHRVIPG
jgi:hypothetical protein